MEGEKLINSTAAAFTSSVPVHGVAPTQVRLDMRTHLFRNGSFDECLPFLLRGRVSDEQFRATMHGLNQTLTSSSGLRTGMWLGVLGTWVTLLALIFSLTVWDLLEWVFVCNGVLIFFALVTIICALAYVVQLRRRVEQYLAEANQFYNPQGVNFRVEKQYRRWSLVIDILPQQSSSADYQQQQPPPPVYYYHPGQLAAPAFSPQQTPAPVVYAAYSPAAYQKPSVDNV